MGRGTSIVALTRPSFASIVCLVLFIYCNAFNVPNPANLAVLVARHARHAREKR